MCSKYCIRKGKLFNLTIVFGAKGVMCCELRLFSRCEEETENLVEIFHGYEKSVCIHPVPSAGCHVFTCYDEPVLHVLCTQSAGAHGHKVFRYVSGLYAMLVKKPYHHVVIGSDLVVGGVSSIIGIHMFAHIKGRVGGHETEAEQERTEQF